LQKRGLTPRHCWAGAKRILFYIFFLPLASHMLGQMAFTLDLMEKTAVRRFFQELGTN
jgi:hypothetical protein